MSYKAIYRTYRPKTFDDVVGQDAIVQTLKHSIENNKIAHAYLFCGPAGTGKTSIAKLMAKAINCKGEGNQVPCNICDSCIACESERNADIIEIDAASNNGVDQIRDIIEQVKYPPLNSRYKVYIIDEVHMLSSGAFNALLKTLEEPPNYVVFILATTEPHKVIPTIISRCQRYDFRKVDTLDMHKRLDTIIANEHISINEDAIQQIMSLANGGMRDCLSILDQCVAYAKDEITIDTINDVYGLTSKETKLTLIESIQNKDVATCLALIDQLNNKGVDFKRLILDLLMIYKEAVAYLYTNDLNLVTVLNQPQIEALTRQRIARQFLDSIDIWLKTNNDIKFSADVLSYFEIACLKNMDVFNHTSDIVSQPIIQPTFESTSKSIASKAKTPEVFSKVNDSVNSIPKVESQHISKEPSVLETPSEVIEVDNKNEFPKVIDNDAKDVIIEKVRHIEQNTPILDEQYILRLMATAQKTCKLEDEERFSHLNEYRMDINSGKIISLLQQCHLFVSGDQFIILESEYEDVIDQLNQEQLNTTLTQFYKQSYFVEKKFFAIHQPVANHSKEKYIELIKSGHKPEPVIIDLKESINIEDPIEKKLKDTFSDLLEIKE